MNASSSNVANFGAMLFYVPLPISTLKSQKVATFSLFFLLPYTTNLSLGEFTS